MEMTLRLLRSDKKGITKRIAQAIEAAGGRMERSRVCREMRGMAETEIVVSFVHASLREAIVKSLAGVSGIALLASGRESSVKERRS